MELSVNGFFNSGGPPYLVDVFLSRKSERLGKLEYFLLTHRAELWGQNSNHPETFSRPGG